MAEFLNLEEEEEDFQRGEKGKYSDPIAELQHLNAFDRDRELIKRFR